MSPRPPSAAPRLPGYEYEQLLGSGGFADVFLYRQARPQRRVAIKVLLADVLDEAVRRQFDAEADVMASVSTHPSIVSVHAADISADHRPYIVMEYCSRPNFGVRFRRERITVAEALRAGVQIAGAVETAHRAGILHRDIKPANILITDYDRPALTDFGISIAAGQAHDLEDSLGMSIPWSPPEAFEDPPRASVRSDVFSLGATLYSLLASQTPFERRGERNTAVDLVHRITSEPLRPLDRPDVPDELNRVLAISMAKSPDQRYESALALGRALQQVELALALPVTQMDVLDDGTGPADHDGEDDDLDLHTRIRKVATVDPERSRRPAPDPFAGIAPALPVASPPSSAAGTTTPSPADGATRLRPAVPPPALPAAPAHGDGEERTGPPAWPFVTLAAVLVVVLGVGATLGVRALVVEEPAPVPTTDTAIAQPTRAPLAPPEDVTVAVVVEQGVLGEAARARVSWALPEGFEEGDYFRVRWKDMGADYAAYGVWTEVYGRASTVIPVPPNIDAPCVEIMSAEPGGDASGTVEACLGGD